MQRNCKLIVSIIALALTSIGVFAQDEVEYKDVILDGKPAKLNVATGEITLVKPETKKSVNLSAVNEVSAAESDFHVVKENETLLDISKNYNVSLTELKRANNLETTLIDKGQRLRVKNLDVHIDSIIQEESNVSDESYSENNNSNFYIVEKDDTLFSLARRYNLSVNQLKSINNLNSSLIYIGQKLRVTEFGSVDNSVSVWTVVSGDTLFSIAQKNGTSVDALKQLNGLTSNLIKVGQKLKLK
ncbi:LysM peptidoglycan-binding domain-containing protein [uncultured Winogradskyella sp.]|uniref:LysM peptidoglycan-binding domain-containing protein n=1 Tax=uncultured Winogradskyella sp. TaxID=395353 RepID=UPI0026165026|nr:LysM peptidoglycan-binding domain-containing protein [uncultured Winogradskyella sp.]